MRSTLQKLLGLNRSDSLTHDMILVSVNWQAVMSACRLSEPNLNNPGITPMFIWLFTRDKVSAPPTATRATAADHLWTRVNVDPPLSKQLHSEGIRRTSRYGQSASLYCVDLNVIKACGCIAFVLIATWGAQYTWQTSPLHVNWWEMGQTTKLCIK